MSKSPLKSLNNGDDAQKAKDKENRNFAFNGWSIDSISLDQAGDLDVEFDLDVEQTTDNYRIDKKGSRTFDIYEDKELEEACRHLFNLIRERMKKPDPEQVKLDCNACGTSTCCRQYNVLADEDDILLLAQGLNTSPEDVIAKYLDPAHDWADDFQFQLKTDDDGEGENKCIFLKNPAGNQMRCSVYEYRPQICRKYDVKCCDDFEPIEV